MEKKFIKNIGKFDIDLIKFKNILRKYSNIVRNLYKNLRFINKI